MTLLTYKIQERLTFSGLNVPNARVKILHDVGMKLLDVCYLKRWQILSKLCRRVSGAPKLEVDHRKTSILGSDFLLLATSIIAAASYIVEKEASDTVSRKFSRTNM